MCKLAGGGVGSFLSHSVPERRRSMAEWLGKKLRSELVPYVSCCTIRRCSCRNKLDSYVPVPLATIVAPFVRATVRISLVRAAALRSVAFCIAFGPSLRVALRPALQQHCALQRLPPAMKDACAVAVPSDDDLSDGWEDCISFQGVVDTSVAAPDQDDGSQPTTVGAAVQGEVDGSQPTEGEVGAAVQGEVSTALTYDGGQAIEDAQRLVEAADGATTTEEAHVPGPQEPQPEPQQQLRRGVGSQPTEMVLTVECGDGPPVHIGIANRVHLFEQDDATWQMLDDDLLEKLKDHRVPFYWSQKTRSGKWHKYWIDPVALHSTRDYSKTQRPMCRKYMFVLPLQEWAVREQTANMTLLSDDGWTFFWQVQDNNGWKHMGLAANKKLLEALRQQQREVDIEHQWQNPKTKRWNRTIYDINIQRMTQKSREGPKSERPVRLVALADPGGASRSSTG